MSIVVLLLTAAAVLAWPCVNPVSSVSPGYMRSWRGGAEH